MPQPLLVQLSLQDPLPNPETAWGRETPAPGLLAIGGGLSTQRLLEAYSQGCFPWYSVGQPVMWWCTDPRMVLPVLGFRLHPSLKKPLKRWVSSGQLSLRIDHQFAQVIQHCAQLPRKGQSGTWIVQEMIQAYTGLHHQGHAHSVEAWLGDELIGGLYCVAIGQAIFGESMFSLQPNGSKVALAGLVALCRAQGVEWIDCQQNTSHLASLGAKEIPRAEFLNHLATATQKTGFSWDFKPIYWDQLWPSLPLK